MAVIDEIHRLRTDPKFEGVRLASRLQVAGRRAAALAEDFRAGKVDDGSFASRAGALAEEVAAAHAALAAHDRRTRRQRRRRALIDFLTRRLPRWR